MTRGPSLSLSIALLWFIAGSAWSQIENFDVSQLQDQVTLEMCRSDLVEIDENGDSKLDRDEYAAFLQLQTGNTMSGEFESLPFRMESVYFSAACMCDVVEANNNECCLQGNDHVPLDTSLSSTIDPYLDFFCYNVQAGLIAEGFTISTLPPVNLPDSQSPTNTPTETESDPPSVHPSIQPSNGPTSRHSAFPSSFPSECPTVLPSDLPSALPTGGPSSGPTTSPSLKPTSYPSVNPSEAPSANPTTATINAPTPEPSSYATDFSETVPTSTNVPTEPPATTVSRSPSLNPSDIPSDMVAAMPSTMPTAPSPALDPVETLCVDFQCKSAFLCVRSDSGELLFLAHPRLRPH